MINFLSRFFRKAKPELVPYYDFATKTITRIPKTELSPGVVLVRIEGQADAVYAESAEFKFGQKQHAPLSTELRALIVTLAADLADVYPQSLEQWEDGFRRDRDAEREIAGWIQLSAILKIMAERFASGPSERKECF